jgi:hypothetical protein
VLRHRGDVPEGRPEPEGTNGRIPGGEPEREEGSHRGAVEAEAARVDPEASGGFRHEEFQVVRLAQAVRDPAPSGRGVASQLREEDVVSEAEGAAGVTPPLRGEAPFAV